MASQQSRKRRRSTDSASSDASADSDVHARSGDEASDGGDARDDLQDDFLSFSATFEDNASSGPSTRSLSPSSAGAPPLPPWSTPRRPGASPLVHLHNEILRFCDVIAPARSETRARREVMDELRQAVTRVWPEAEVHIYGSELTGLCLPSSDLDMTVLGVPDKTTRPLHTLAGELRQSGIVSYLQVIDQAKVPIIKLVHERGMVAADMSFGQPDGLKTGWLVREHLEKMPPLRPLLLLLKYFLMQRELNETYPSGGVGSFLLQLMAISFMQQRRHEEKVMGTAPNDNLGGLLLDFFDLYGRKFNYSTTGISVRDGGSYFRKADRGWLNPSRPQLLAVENPQSPEFDVGKNAFNIVTIRRAFEHGYHVLVAALSAPADRFPSVLGVVVQVDEILQQRSIPADDSGGRFTVWLPDPPQPRDSGLSASNQHIHFPTSEIDRPRKQRRSDSRLVRAERVKQGKKPGKERSEKAEQRRAKKRRKAAKAKREPGETAADAPLSAAGKKKRKKKKGGGS